jgi:GDPmannose 4,6-dehydratase
VVVAVDPNYFRPTEVDLLVGDPTKAQEKLNWKPKYNLQNLIAEMVAADVDVYRKEIYVREAGYKIYDQYE